MTTQPITLYGKLWSTAPKQYRFIPEGQARVCYAEYLKQYANSQFDNNLINAKTFKEWLATEV